MKQSKQDEQYTVLFALAFAMGAGILIGLFFGWAFL